MEENRPVLDAETVRTLVRLVERTPWRNSRWRTSTSKITLKAEGILQSALLPAAQPRQEEAKPEEGHAFVRAR